MSAFVVQGGRRLEGSVQVHGAKNSVLPILAASLLSGGECVIKNCPGGTLEQPLSVPWVRQVPLSPTEGAGPAVPGKDGEGAQCGGKPAGHSGKGNGSIFT